MTRPTRASVLTALILVLFASSALASPDTLVLREGDAAGLSLKTADGDGCTVVFDLPALERSTLRHDGRTYQTLGIPGGALDGGVGLPGLPIYGGMLEVPAGRGVRAEVTTRDDVRLSDTLLQPVQAEGDDGFVIAPTYADTAKDAPLVTLGEPAILYGRRVVPFTVRPVRFDARTETVDVITSLEIVFTFEGTDTRNDPQRRSADLPASFGDLLAGRVVNASAPGAKAAETTDLGTYLVVCPNDSEATAALQPLLEWRRRQGYAVELRTVSSSSSNSSIKSVIQGVYDTADPALEFVTLVGDDGGDLNLETWFESYFGGEGDHEYSELEGSDVLPDVFLGRLSCRTVTQLEDIVAKIVSYETAPPMGDTSWYTYATLTADPGQSGTSTIYVSQWLKAQLEMVGYTQVDTFWSGNFATNMLNTLNQGAGFFSYRGYLGMSGFSASYANNLGNGGELPFALFPTCDSGSWASESTARNEAFLRNPNGGAIGAIGLATINTHTRYNNCLYHGISQQAVHGPDHRQGVAQAAGKLEMYAHYGAYEPHNVEIWSTWSSLIGDPATDLWMGVPKSLDVEHPAALPSGAGTLPVTVTWSGQPMAGVLVAATKNGEVRVTGVTDASGQAVLVLPAHSPGTLLVTAWGHGLLPYRGAATLGTVNRFCELDHSSLDGDGVANPAETLALSCALRNLGTDLAGAVTATLASDDPYATVVDGADDFGDIGAGATVWGADGFTIQIAPDAPHGHELALTLTAQSGADAWISAVRLPVTASAPVVSATAWNSGTTLDPGESGLLTVQVRNDGGALCDGAVASLTTTSPWVNLDDGTATYGDIAVGATVDNAGDRFALSVDPGCFGGHLAAFELELTELDGAVRTVEFTLPVGSIASTEPLGPDAYGYYAVDDTDTGATNTPVFDWVEIDPTIGGQGTSVGLSDFGYEQDDSKVVDLPFTFTYYGRDYDRMAICSNGWVAMGTTSLVHWRNWAIPSDGSPDAMIAPFWDDLEQSGTNQVYWWHDAANHRVIVEWSRMKNRYNGSNTFQVILHDPVIYPTATGDGRILFQYQQVTNNDTGRGYATVGIQNLTGDDGLLYTYYNDYAPGAATLVPGRAILFEPYGSNAVPTCDVTPGVLSVALDSGESTVETLRVENNGEEDSSLHFSLEKDDPDEQSGLPDGEKNLTGSTLTTSVTEYTPGETIDMPLDVYCNSDDQEWIERIEMDFPTGVTVNSATGFEASNDLVYGGLTGDGAFAYWNNGYIREYEVGTASINVTFSSVTETVEIPYVLFGDNFGQPPHQVSGVITLESSGPEITVISPNGGERWEEGQSVDIEFSVANGPSAVDIDLDLGDGSGWQNLASDVSAGAGSWTWTVTSNYSDACRIRVSDASDPSVSDESNGVFTIGHNLSWLTIGAVGGVLADGESEDVDITIDAAGLADGLYMMTLVVINNAGEALRVPVELAVGTALTLEDLPTRVSLERNYPNPFNPSTVIAFALPTDGAARLEIFDLQGRLVRSLIDGNLPAGHHVQHWDGTDTQGRRVASGMFVYRLSAAGKTLSRKLVLTK